MRPCSRTSKPQVADNPTVATADAYLTAFGNSPGTPELAPEFEEVRFALASAMSQTGTVNTSIEIQKEADAVQAIANSLSSKLDKCAVVTNYLIE